MKARNKITILTAVCLMLSCGLCKAASDSSGVTKRSITLNEAILMARTQSVDAAVALNELKTSYWEYRTYKAELLPEINFTGTIPSYNKRYSSYQNDDGSYSFVRNNYVDMKGEFSVTQNLWPTGGTLSLETSLDYIKQLDGNKFREFMSVPFAVTLNQPLFGVNTVKWDRRIEPVKYEEAKAGFLSATEEVTMNTIQYFFNLLLAKENLNITRQNLRNAKKLYEVAQAKRKMGQISENDMLQLKLNLLKAQSKLTDNESSLKSNMFKMRSFLGMDDDTELVPVIPNNTSSLFLKYKDVLQKALLNNSFSKNILRREMQADYDVAKARGNLRNISLYAQLGYTGVNKDLGSAYDHLNGNQVVEIGVKIPLLDWGKRRGQVKVAESNREVIESKIKQEKMNFNQNLFILVEEFNNQLSQLNIAKESDKIAERRYDTNVKTFMVGKISTLDLNDSQSSKDEARQKYINELFYYWYYYYQVRSLTLWDFEHDTNIDADFDKIVKN